MFRLSKKPGAVHALNKVLVKTLPDTGEPEDIAVKSDVVKTLRSREKIQRIYAPDSSAADEIRKILEGIEK